MTTKQQEIIKRWIKALRNGEYKQTEGELHDDVEGSFCVMGVLTDMAVKAGVVPKTALDAHAALPAKVVKWAGMRNSSGQLADDSNLSSDSDDDLIERNDNGTSFKQLANTIEYQLRLVSKGTSKLFVGRAPKAKVKTRTKSTRKIEPKIHKQVAKTPLKNRAVNFTIEDLAAAGKSSVETTVKA